MNWKAFDPAAKNKHNGAPQQWLEWNSAIADEPWKTDRAPINYREIILARWIRKSNFQPAPKPERNNIIGSFFCFCGCFMLSHPHREQAYTDSWDQSWNNSAVIGAIQRQQVWADLWVISHLITLHATLYETQWRYLPPLCAVETRRRTRIC